MESLNLGHARLLYIIAEMYKIGRLNELEKYRLKEAVFLNDEMLFQYYEQNFSNESSDPRQLMDFLENLVRNRFNTRVLKDEAEGHFEKNLMPTVDDEEDDTNNTSHQISRLTNLQI